MYAINEPAAYGGYAALKAAGKEKGVTVVAVDGGCQGVKWVKDGIIGATSQQYPLLMAADGVQAVADFIKTGKKPTSIDTGEKLVTDHPVAGVPSIMRGMLQDVGHRLKGGKVVIARTVRVEGFGEGVIAAPLEAVAKNHPGESLGSYPFFSADGYGANLVIRGRDADEVETTVVELIAALEAVGVTNIKRVEG